MTKMTKKPEKYLMKSAIEQGIHALDCNEGEGMKACRLGGGVEDALNGIVDQLLDEGAARARANKRITIYPHDLGVLPKIDKRFK